MREVVTQSAAETIALAREFGLTLRPGAVVLLTGELGAGKTTFVKGVALACGVTAGVTSPTYSLMQRYEGSPDVVHIDLFRETQAAGLEDFELDEIQDQVITLVEWPKHLASYLWSDTISVVMEHVGETSRRIRLP